MLTPEEVQELKVLQGMDAQTRAPAQGRTPGLTLEEEQELALLTGDMGQTEEGGILSSIGSGIVKAGEFIDSYSGAPTRAALGAAVTGNNPLTAFGEQFGEDPKLAPTGKEIARVIGFSPDPLSSRPVPVEGAHGRIITDPKTGGPLMKQEVSPAGMVGTIIDIGADVSNFIPVGMVVKAGAKGTTNALKAAGKFALKGSVAAADIATGTKVASESAETVSKYIDRVVNSTKSRFNPKQAPDFETYTEIAKKNNIDPSILPETVEFGPNHTITKKSQVMAEGPGGEVIQDRYLKAQGAVEDALDNQIATIGGGVKHTDADAGQMLIDSYNKGIKSFFDQDMITHQKVINDNPGIILNQDALKSVQSKVKGLKNKATGRARRGFGEQQAQANQLLKDLDVLERSFDKNGNLSYKRASEMLTNLGEEAFRKNPAGSKTPIDQKGLQELYFSLRDAMYESAGHTLGKEKATELAMNNQIISDFLKEKGRISKLFEGDIAPEKLFKRIAESGDTKQINAIKEIMSPDDFRKLKGAMLNKVIIRNAEGSPLYKSTIRNLERKKSLLAEAFSPEEMKEFTDVLRLGDRVGDFVFNTSKTNTAARFSATDWLKEVVAGGTDELTLEKLKERARGKSGAIEVPFKDMSRDSAKNASSLTRRVPLLQSQARQTVEGGKIASIQGNNKEIERRKRAISGARK